MQRWPAFSIVGLMAVALLGFRPAPAVAQTSVVRCESSGGARTQCPIPQPAQVSLSRLISSTPCKQNENWGVSGGSIWVTAGCRAEFTVTVASVQPPVTPPTRVTCESKRGDRQKCPVPAGSTIRMVRQLSTNPCKLNETYGQGSDYLWVDEGCRAEFEATQPSYGGGIGGGPVTRITCESSGNAQRSCPFPKGSTARFVSQLSNQPCVLNRSYGLSTTFVWVSRGCRAVFEVRGGLTGGNGGGGGGGPSYTKRVTCESQTPGRQRCVVPGATAVRLARQISVKPCELDRTFGTQINAIWVSDGCRGDFEVTVSGAPGGPGNGPAERLTCASSGGERVECRFRQVGRVTLVRQISTTQCVEKSTWGVGFGGVMWVDKGCRGEFESRP